MSIEELRKDVAELVTLLAQTQRPRVKDVLTATKHQIEMEIVNLEIKAKAMDITPSAVKKSSAPKRFCKELTEYAFDQSDKFLKLFVTLSGASALSESDVSTTFTDNSLQVLVNNLNNVDYSFKINNLLHPIDGSKSYFKIKSNMIAVYVKKQKEAQHWSHLTTLMKRSSEVKESEFKGDSTADALGGDPTAGLMNVMKKMYETGDPETKRMIAKAWTEGQEKSMNMNM